MKKCCRLVAIVCNYTLKSCAAVLKSLNHAQLIVTPPGSSASGIQLARLLKWIAMPFSRGSSQPRGRTQVSHIAGGFFTV